MKSVFRKLIGKRGFTLAETMIAVLILLMVVSIVGAAIPTASSVYTKAVDTANAQVLLSTAMTVLRDELGNATEVDISSDKKTIQYRSGNNGRISKVFYSSADFSVTDSDGGFAANAV